MKTKEIVPVQNQFTSSYFEITASPKIHNPDENKINPKRARTYLLME